MNQSDKIFDTVAAVVDDIIAEMPLDDRVRVANLDEDGLIVLQLGLGKYLRYLIDKQSGTVKEKLMADCIKQSGNEALDEAEAASYFLKEIWNRLRKTHRLRVFK
jgi:hypothetical protein